jgi:hypothetical protein
VSLAVLQYNLRLNNTIEIISLSIQYYFPLFINMREHKIQLFFLKVTDPSLVHVLSLSHFGEVTGPNSVHVFSLSLW